MSDDRDDRLIPSPAERHIARSRIDERPAGPLTEQQLYTQRSVESYLRGAVMPRYMERLRDITRQTERHLRALGEAYAELRERHAGDAHGFARAWRELVDAWPLHETNALIDQHNEWYPVERQLPFDLRTRDYVLIAGRPYRREHLTPDWVYARLPPEPEDG